MKFDPPFIFSLFVLRSALVLLVGATLGGILRKRNPAGAKLALRSALALSVACILLPTSLKQPPHPILNVAPPPVPAVTNLPNSSPSDLVRPAPLAPEEAAIQRLSPKSFPTDAPTEVATPYQAFHVTPLSTWLVGVALGLLVNGFGILLLASINRQGKNFGDESQLRRLEYTANNLGIRLPHLKTTNRLDTPCVAGLFRPTIFIPEGAVATLELSDLQTLVLHEMIHVRNRDCLWNVLSRLISALLWFNPLVWIVSNGLSLVTEEVCDAGVIENGLSQGAYANSLVSIAKKIQAKPSHAHLGVGIFESESSLGRRLQKILNSRISARASKRSKLVVFSGIGVAALGGGLAIAGVVTEPIRLVPYYNANGNTKAFPNSSLDAEALLADALAKPKTLESFQETISCHYIYKPIGTEVFRVTRLNSQGLGRVDVLKSIKGGESQVLVEPGKDFFISDIHPNRALEYDSTALKKGDWPIRDYSRMTYGLGLSMSLAGDDYGYAMRGFEGRTDTASFGPERTYENRPALTVFLDSPGERDRPRTRYTIDKQSHMLMEVAFRSDKYPTYVVVTRVSDISENQIIDPSQLRFKADPSTILTVVKVKAHPVPKAVQSPTPRPLTALEGQIQEAIYSRRSLSFVDVEEEQQFEPGNPNLVSQTKEHRLSGTTESGERVKLTLEDLTNPSNSGTMWSDGAYLWLTRTQDSSKYLKVISDSEGRLHFGGLNSEVECPSGMAIMGGLYLNNFWGAKLLSTDHRSLNGVSVDCLHYQIQTGMNELVLADHKTHQLVQLETRITNPVTRKLMSRKTETLTFKPLNQALPDSTFVFKPGPNMIEVDTAGELR